ncbi:MAG: L-fucokinase, partial [Kiritimatiellia bacterium]|nr:L-fucokinase [Kiritimatiellia bacterium]
MNSTLILSLPPAMTRALPECEARTAAMASAFHDPVQARLGSGGGTAHVLWQAWQQTASPGSFDEWLASSLKTVIHGGGQSRRLPPYAATGKLFIPIPVFRWSRGQRLDQSLLDLQMEFLNRVRRVAAPGTRCMVSSGDVLLQSATDLSPLPEADVVLLGLWAQPEEAQRFGVLFCDRARPEQLEFFLQKPSPDRIREGAKDHVFLLDVGVWLLSERAVACLMKKCGWETRSGAFAKEGPSAYDLYGSWALHLGRQPARPDPEVSALSVAVVPLSTGEFYHFGSSRDMIESSYRLQTKVVDQLRLGAMGARPHPKQFVQNALFSCPLRQ